MFQFWFSKMICKKKNLSLVTGTDGNFRLSGDCFCSTTTEHRYCVNSPPRDRKNPICTGYWWNIIILQDRTSMLYLPRAVGISNNRHKHVRWRHLKSMKIHKNHNIPFIHWYISLKWTIQVFFTFKSHLTMSTILPNC